MIILEAAVCGGVELYCIILTGVSVIQPTLTDINVVDKIIEIGEPNKLATVEHWFPIFLACDP